MIDLSAETVLSFTDAAKRLPGRPHISTIHRWRLHGVKGVRLETALVGGRRVTSLEALQRFCDQLSGGVPSPVGTRTPRQCERAIEAAERELSKAGI